MPAETTVARRRGRRVVLWIVLAGMGAMLLSLAAAPLYAGWQLKRAADAGDDAAPAHWIDFPSLRTDLRRQLNERAQATDRIGWLTQLRARTGGAIDRSADALVAALISPKAIALLARGQEPSSSARAARATPRESPQLRFSDETLDRCVIAVRQPQAPPIEFVFGRRGLWFWQLEGLRLAPR